MLALVAADLDELRDLLPWLPQNKRHATQRAAIQAVIDHDGDRLAAADAIGRNLKGIRDSIYKARRSAAAKGWDPSHPTAPVPDGMHVRRRSTLRKPRWECPECGHVEADRVVLEWTQAQKGAEERAEAMRAFVLELADPVRGAAEPVEVPPDLLEDLLVVIPVGDHHLGMLAHRSETGENWDTKKGEAILRRAIDRAIEVAPPAGTCVLAFMGDFFHADTSAAVTPKSGHLLDVDTRFPEISRIASRLTRYCIEQCLRRFGRVSFLSVGGNHDPHASDWLAIVADAYYENEPRVDVLDPRRGINFVEHGRCLLAFCHGHGIKLQDVPIVTAADAPEAWGRTVHRHGYTGHIHSRKGIQLVGDENAAMYAEAVRILPPKDRYAAHNRWRAGRSLIVDVWHAAHGHRMRHTIGVGEIQA